MSHVWRNDACEQDVIAAKGAPEAVADLCHLPPQDRQRWHAQATQLAERGLRVLGVAKAQHNTDQRWPDGQHDFAFEWLGLIGLSDPLRPEVPAAVAQCHSAGIRVIMITGDHPHTAQSIAQQAGIAPTTVITGAEMASMDTAALAQRLDTVNVFARVKPEQKLNLVNALKTRGDVVAMTGDGVNDAPALKAAHIGIAMGTGTDVAIESAGVTLLKGDLIGIVRARRLSQATMANIRQNLLFAFVYNAAGVPVAAGLLYPWFGILLSPMIAAAAMALSSVSVVSNALRLSRLQGTLA